jgi:hypothetical protein
VKEVQWPIITLPTSVCAAQFATVQIPVGDVVARVFFDPEIIEKHRDEVDETLVNKVTIYDVYDTMFVQFVFPPLQESPGVQTRIDSYEAKVELSCS